MNISVRLKVGKYAEDNFAMTQYIPKVRRISVLDEKLYFYLQREDSAVHNYSIKNLDRIEADFERCEYFMSKSMWSELKNTIFSTVSLLINAYSKLDLSINSNKERYSELRKRASEKKSVKNRAASFCCSHNIIVFITVD